MMVNSSLITMSPKPEDDVAPLHADVVALIDRKGGGVSFVELMTIPGARGTQDLKVGGQNVLLWANVSPALVTAISDLMIEGRIDLVGAHPVVYVADGTVMNLPLVKTMARIKRGYASPHWLPVTIEKGPNWALPSSASP
jgi:hypothetical protein